MRSDRDRVTSCEIRTHRQKDEMISDRHKDTAFVMRSDRDTDGDRQRKKITA